jgi:hypothetical protein
LAGEKTRVSVNPIEYTGVARTEWRRDDGTVA